MLKLTDDNFKDIIQNGSSLILDFGAAWCSPCKKLEPILEELSEKYSAIPFYKCDVGENQQVASHFHIFSVPTVIFFKEGREINRISGLRNAEFFEGEIQKLS